MSLFKTLWLLLTLSLLTAGSLLAQRDQETLRVFIFAGQSNMVGSDSKVADIQRFPPFAGLDEPQKTVKFWFDIGRENKTQSGAWKELAPVNDLVGPELSFARRVSRESKAPIAIIKCAAGGTHLGGDWNPDSPTGFKMYPRALDLVRKALANLDRRKIRYRLEGFMWHQGENDMFNDDSMSNYGTNLKNFITSWRRDLKCPALRFYVGELCTKTIWGMDLRRQMHAISVGQKEVCTQDPRVDYVPTSHIGVEIGEGVGLHYHYGTLGQLEHGENYAKAYLATIGRSKSVSRKLRRWPYKKESKVTLFVLAGHRNMEGERAFVQDLAKLRSKARLRKDNQRIAFKYSLGGGYAKSTNWEPLGPVGFYDTFGPELSFGASLKAKWRGPVAIAKFTHSGSQVIDWTPEGSAASSRNLYSQFIAFVQEAIRELEEKGHSVEVAGIFYHLGENDTSYGPFRAKLPESLASLVQQSRVDLKLKNLTWIVSQQPPTKSQELDRIDVTAGLAKIAASDEHLTHWKVFDLPKEQEQLVMTAKGIVALGEQLAKAFLTLRVR